MNQKASGLYEGPPLGDAPASGPSKLPKHTQGTFFTNPSLVNRWPHLPEFTLIFTSSLYLAKCCYFLCLGHSDFCLVVRPYLRKPKNQASFFKKIWQSVRQNYTTLPAQRCSQPDPTGLWSSVRAHSFLNTLIISGVYACDKTYRMHNSKS